MKGFIQTIKNIWNIKELREKLLFTLGLLLVYRFGSYVVLPGIDPVELDRLVAAQAEQSGSGGILGLLNAFTGGALSRGSVLALGIMPYISASIVVQLAGLAIPYLQKLDKEGESGQKKKTQLTRWLTIAICLVQAPAYLTLLSTQLIPYSGGFASAFLYAPSSFWFWFPATVILVTGTVFSMWLGEKITDRGIGNGISILIMVGILADLPRALFSAIEQDNSGGIFFTLEMVALFIAIMLCVILVAAVRRVPLQYVSRAQAGQSSTGFMKSMTQSTRSYLPLKVNAAGVMPIIFAQAIMFLPGLLANSETVTGIPYIGGFFAGLGDYFSFSYNLVFFILIVLFTFFYTAITIPVSKMADDLKRSGAIVPGVKPGRDTAEFLDEILSRITLPGSIFLALLAILPAFVKLVNVPDALAIFFGGTSLLIMVGVILDTVQQINAYLLNHHYDGLMKTGRTQRQASGF